MKLKKTGILLIVLCLIVGMLFGLAACGKRDPEDSTEDTTGGQETNNTEDDPSAPLSGHFIKTKVTAVSYSNGTESSRFVWEYRYTARSADSYRDGEHYIHYEFDENGYWTQYTKYEGDEYGVLEIPDWRTIAPVIKYLEYPGDMTMHHADGGTSTDSFIEYNADGKAIKWSSDSGVLAINSDGYSGRFTYYKENGDVDYYYDVKVDAEGMPKNEIVMYNADGTLKGVPPVAGYEYVYAYDEYGCVSKRVTYLDDAVYAITEYDEYGNEIRSSKSRADGILVPDYEYEYDATGRYRLKVTQYDDDGNASLLYPVDIEYDAKGNVTKYVGGDGSVDRHYTAEYDENGNVTKMTWYDSDGNITSVEEFEWREATETQWKSTKFPLYEYFR